MTVPLAVSPSAKTPGVYVSVDLSAGAAAAGVGTLSILLIAPKSSSGDLTDDSEIRAGAGEASAATAFGRGTIGHRMAELIYGQDAGAQVDFAAPTAGGGTATLDVTASGVPTADNAVEFNVDGNVVEVLWLASETADEFKARAIAELDAAVQGKLPTAHSSGGVGIVQIDSKVTGNLGNDIQVRAKLVNAQTGTEAIDTNTFTNLAGGTTDPDLTTVLSNAQGKEYHYIVAGLSNADAQSNGGTSNPARVEAHINAYNTGLDAKLQQAVVASTGSIANAKVGAIARNEGTFEHVCCVNALSLPGEFAAREAGGRLAAVKLYAAKNRAGLELTGLFGSPDVIADRPTTPESEDALSNGVAIVSYNSSGDPLIVRPITTQSQDSAGGSDTRLLDVQNVDVAYVVVRDIRSALPQEFAGASIIEDLAPGEDPPEGGEVVEVRDVRGFVVQRLRTWATAGVIQRAPLEAAIADGSLVVRINPSDATQVDMVLPFKAVQPLLKFGVVGQRQPG